MKRLKKNIKFSVGAVLAAVLVSTFSAQSAMAYFTTYATAKGGVRVSLDSARTTVEEEFKDWKKTIRIRNSGLQPCYVRVKVLAGSQYTISASGTNWSQGSDGYWYYANPVPSGGVTEEALVASITVPAGLNMDFDVVVVEECTMAVYDEAGNPTGAANADWTRAAQYVEEAE
ncbi:MAG: hypothetical protein NC180_00320 [Muribaculaceae bacterium]|nr:hypothetical protein [Roseburia sp.]MCM1431670.1 hypothetical protein [Muribaculaceae bacterium]MCM1491658.1 hypothetical protein [Muribaculaceae bacterium]